MKKTLKKIFDEANADEIDNLVNQNAEFDISADTLSSIKKKVYAKTGIDESKRKKHLTRRWLYYAAVAACLVIIVTVGVTIIGMQTKKPGPDVTTIPVGSSTAETSVEPTTPDDLVTTETSTTFIDTTTTTMDPPDGGGMYPLEWKSLSELRDFVDAVYGGDETYEAYKKNAPSDLAFGLKVLDGEENRLADYLVSIELPVVGSVDGSATDAFHLLRVQCFGQSLWLTFESDSKVVLSFSFIPTDSPYSKPDVSKFYRRETLGKYTVEVYRDGSLYNGYVLMNDAQVLIVGNVEGEFPLLNSVFSLRRLTDIET